MCRVEYSINSLPERISNGFTVIPRKNGSPSELTVYEGWAVFMMVLKEEDSNRPLPVRAHHKNSYRTSAFLFLLSSDRKRD
jgi:hypothetical protein